MNILTDAERADKSDGLPALLDFAAQSVQEGDERALVFDREAKRAQDHVEARVRASMR
jgi:hypothetical protein